MDKQNTSVKVILTIICVGIWANVLQNAGVIPTKQNVYVKGGYIDVRGSVDIDNTVDVGGYMNVNISAINGHRNAFYQDSDGDYVILPVTYR